MTTTQRETFPYYAGDIATGNDPTPGVWEGEIFTAADGSKWKSLAWEEAPTSGGGVYYLIPADTKVFYFESFDRDTLNEGEVVEIEGEPVTVGELIDCGRMCSRRYWWFYAA